jgi:hypothetical protein
MNWPKNSMSNPVRRNSIESRKAVVCTKTSRGKPPPQDNIQVRAPLIIICLIDRLMEQNQREYGFIMVSRAFHRRPVSRFYHSAGNQTASDLDCIDQNVKNETVRLCLYPYVFTMSLFPCPANCIPG